MKIIHQNGYTVDELALYRHTVYKNLLDCAKALISAMRQFGEDVEHDSNRELCTFIMDYSVDPDPDQPLNPKLGEAISSVWKDPCVPRVLDHQSEFYLMDSAP